MNKASVRSRMPRSDFDRRLVVAIGSLTEGEVVSYGDIAKRAGNERAPRAVGRFLSLSQLQLPWWRVVRADGSLSTAQPTLQTELLIGEGVEVRDGKVLRAPRGRFK